MNSTVSAFSDIGSALFLASLVIRFYRSTQRNLLHRVFESFSLNNEHAEESLIRIQYWMLLFTLPAPLYSSFSLVCPDETGRTVFGVTLLGLAISSIIWFVPLCRKVKSIIVRDGLIPSNYQVDHSYLVVRDLDANIEGLTSPMN